MQVDVSSAPPSASRYETLLQQIVQLNADLQKTAALSQSLQRERDGLQVHNSKLKDETKRLHERCEKLQVVLMQETENRIEADKKHDELIAKWKKQLELKARAFENLQKKFAPPRDLDQLRIQIQEELEEPHQQRVEQLQQELERQRQAMFSLRRECEALKTEYEQFAIDQGNEMEALHSAYEATLDDMKRKMTTMEHQLRETQASDALRRAEQQREAALVEVKMLQSEVQDVREEMKKAKDAAANELSGVEARLADEMARAAMLELDHKAAIRQLTRANEDYEAMRGKWDHAQTKLLELGNENDKIREQIKQKEALIVSSHQSVSAKLREEREGWERERAMLKDRVSELTMKLQAAENAILVSASQRKSPLSSDSTNESGFHEALLKSKEEEIDKYKQLAAVMERKAAEKEDELRVALEQGEDELTRAKSEQEQLRLNVTALERERDQLNAKLVSAQELLSKVKSECVALRAKVKEMEMDYRALQAKHRDTIQLHEDIALEKEQMEARLKFAETDCLTLREKVEKEKEDHLTTARDWQRKYASLEAETRAQKSTLREETKRALSRAMRELDKAQKKRDAFKQKCLEIHEQYKRLNAEFQRVEARELQLKHDHASELQHLLSQLAQVENDKTVLLQKQIEPSGLNRHN